MRPSTPPHLRDGQRIALPSFAQLPNTDAPAPKPPPRYRPLSEIYDDEDPLPNFDEDLPPYQPGPRYGEDDAWTPYEPPPDALQPHRQNASVRPLEEDVFPRKILVLKGIVFGLPPDKYAEAFAVAKALITAQGITTVCWDGDKYTYPGPGNAPPAASFTRLLVALREAMPQLEFLFFKEEGKAAGLLHGIKEPKADKFGNVLGPFPFLTRGNTTIVSEETSALPYTPGTHYGVEFAGPMEWHQLGLKGLVYIKTMLRVQHVTYMVFGLGNAVKRELKEVAEDPFTYPSGITDGHTVVEVERPEES